MHGKAPETLKILRNDECCVRDYTRPIAHLSLAITTLADRYTARRFGPERRTAEGSKVFSSDIDARIGRPFKLVKVDNQSPNSLARSVPQEINREIAEVE